MVVDFDLENIDPDQNCINAIFNAWSDSNGETAKIYSVADYNKLKSTNNNFLTYMTYNIRSYRANYDTFESMFYNSGSFPDVLVLTETWFTAVNTENIAGYNSYHTTRSNRRSVGVSVYVNSILSSKVISQFSYADEIIEISVVEINLGSASCFILGVYRPHSGNVPNFISSLQRILEGLRLNGSMCLIMGDFNIDLLKENNDSENFSNFMFSYNFLPTINKPTRYPAGNMSSTPSLIDNIWTNSLSNCNSGIILNDITDHCPIFVQLLNETSVSKKSEKIKISFRPHDEHSKNIFQTNVENYEWTQVVDDNIDIYVENFISAINDIYCKSFPLKIKYVSPKQFLNPWVNSRVKQLIDLKSKYFNLQKLGIVTRSENNIVKNKIKKCINKCKRDYFVNKFFQNKNNLRGTWNIINELLLKNVSKQQINSIIWNDVEHCDPQQIASIFNSYFNSVASDLDQSLPTNSLDPLLHTNYVPHSIFLSPVTPEECRLIIMSLKITKEHRDSIPVYLFKSVSHILAYVICDMINQCFSLGKFPDTLKFAVIVPIHKSGSKLVIFNFRPISLLKFLSKIFERCMYSRFLDFIRQNCIISPNQFGFLQKKSTEDALLKFTEYIYNSLNKKMYTAGILIDFKKAFDTVNHNILLKKLYRYGFRGLPLNLISSYLQNRPHTVKINNCFSDSKISNLGVPQGSILGPLLFILYINDIFNIFTVAEPILFADDTTLCVSASSSDSLKIVCDAELEIFSAWAVSNRLSINTSKTSFLLFTKKTTPLDFYLSLGNDILEKSTCCKLLGVFIDDGLSFKNHISYICSKVSKQVGILYKLRDYVQKNTLLDLYYSFVYPYLNYCVTLWGGTFDTHLIPLFILQKRIVRIINFASYLAHTSPLFYLNKILKLRDIYIYNAACYFFKNPSLLLPTRVHSYETRGRNDLLAPFQRLTLTQHSVYYRGVGIWNDLPTFVTGSPSLKIFKSRLKEHLISKYTGLLI